MSAVFEVINPGLFTTYQDMGRPGHLSWGISHCGVMDSRMAATANAKIGNALDVVVLEFAHIPPKLKVLQSAAISIEAVACEIFVNEQLCASPLQVKKDQIINIKLKGGVYGYMAINGGFDAPVEYGSASHHHLTKMGGGKLEKGQLVYTLGTYPQEKKTTNSASIKLSNYHNKTIKCYRGIEFSSFNEKDIIEFLEREHVISADSNRMGIVMTQEEPFTHDKSIISSPVIPGTLQLPPNGNIIVLGKDGQSIGGYPRIGTIIREDMAIIAQKRPGSKIKFQLVNW